MNLIAEPAESADISVKEEPISENFDNATLDFNDIVKKEEYLPEDEGENLDNSVKKEACFPEDEAGNFYSAFKKEEFLPDEEGDLYSTIKKEACFSEDEAGNFYGTVKKEACFPEDETGNEEENSLSFSGLQTEEEERKEVMAEDIFTLWKIKKEDEEGSGNEKVIDVPPVLWSGEDNQNNRTRKRKAIEAPPSSCGARQRKEARIESPSVNQPRPSVKSQRKRQWNNGSEPSKLRVKQLETMQQNKSSELEFCYVCVDDIAEGCSFKEHFDQTHRGSCLCFICGVPCSSFASFLNHLNSHPLFCQHCNQPFLSRRDSLLHHKFYHDPNDKSLLPMLPKPEDCPSSHERTPVFKANYAKAEHLTPNQINVFRADLREGDVCDVKTQLKQQVLEVKDEIVGVLSNCTPLSRAPKLNHICDLCQKGFRTRQHLRRHEFTHREKPQICKQCCLSFNTLEDLKEHRINVHAGNLPFVCTICGLAYEKSVSFRDHMKKIHFGGKKGYQCELCSKVLSNRLIYQTHLRTHSGEKPFKCAVCGKSYHDKYSMLKHERLHTAQPIYKCPLCEKSYNRSCLMTEHIKWNHAITSEVEMSNYLCGVCQEELGNADCFLRHVYNHSCDELSYNAVEIMT